VTQHGDGARSNGERIGACCWIDEQVVTIVYSNETVSDPDLSDGAFGPPVQHVRVGAGLRISGAATVREGTASRANAVIVRDDPACCTAVGVYPAHILRENGQRVTRSF